MRCTPSLMRSDTMSAISLLPSTYCWGYYCCRWIRKDMTIVEEYVVIFLLSCSLLAAVLFLALLAGRHSDSTPGNYYCLFPLLLCVFLWMYRLISVVIYSWKENGQEWAWCCSRMDIRVCVVFSFSVFFVWVCTIFIGAVFLWAPEHFCVTSGWILEISLLNWIELNSHISLSQNPARGHKVENPFGNKLKKTP